jgi:hypothetical protein
MARAVTLMLVDESGDLLGALPTFTIVDPWWQDVAEVVEAARVRFGIEIDVLRVLRGLGDGRPASGGEVTYLCQVDTRLSGRPDHLETAPEWVDLSGHPLRMPWAESGGPAESVRWAREALAAGGVAEVTAVQQRSWNLSALWRLDAPHGPVAWLKQVPPFYVHEPAVLRLVRAVAPHLAPEPLADDGRGRMLLAHVPGADAHGADAATRSRVAALLHPVQERYAGAVDVLQAASVPDRRLDRERFVEVAGCWSDRLDGIGGLVASLPERLRRIAACGMPDTLVHGDLHAGNVRVGPPEPVIIDWGDACLSHPAYDILRLTADLPEHEATNVCEEWIARWRVTAPGSDPRGALELMRPLAAWWAAVTMHSFVTSIEPAERIYHADDERDAMASAVRAAG